MEEFGLSRYETRAYTTLLSKGPLSASEIAYYAHLPRTKIYSVLTSLSKKGLVVITHSKPIVCNAVPPDEAFGDTLAMQENRVSNMKSTIEKLQKVSEGNRPYRSNERTYLVLEAESVPSTLEELFSASKAEIACIIDRWGLRILSHCKHTVLKTIAKVNTKVLVGMDCPGNNILTSMTAASIRVGDVNANMFLFDRSAMIVVNGNNGKGVLFQSADVLTGMYCKIFDLAWGKSVETFPLDTIEQGV